MAGLSCVILGNWVGASNRFSSDGEKSCERKQTKPKSSRETYRLG